MEKDISKAEDATWKYTFDSEGVDDKRLMRAFKKELKKHNARLANQRLDSTDLRQPASFVINKENLKDNLNKFNEETPHTMRKGALGRLKNELKRSIGKDKSLVVLAPEETADLAFHELGHIRNSNFKPKRHDILGRIKKSITNRGSREGRLSKVELVDSGKIKNLEDNSTSIKEAWKRFKDAKSVRMEEDFASKEALKRLKANGATKEQLETARKHLKTAGDTYGVVDIMYKSPIKNLVQIPSRRPVAEKARQKMMENKAREREIAKYKEMLEREK